MITLATLGLIFSASSTANDLSPDLVPKSSVDTCVAEISDYADYTAATRVRHDVESEQRRTVGHILRIDTLVYGDVDGRLLREYTTRCVVGASVEPLYFEIKETRSRS
jgi:hypothetical protein